ncbi:MAG: GWxTD domain-containing protein [Acidobacteriota bacterium]|nr:GWxTD domain-containing protein [Acidobacteriota bacterium]
MRSFSIYCVGPSNQRQSGRRRRVNGLGRLGLALTLALALSPPTVAAKGKRAKELAPEDLTNFFLNPSLSQWLVGPMSKIATEEERRRFLALTDDQEAESFIVDFWEVRRDPNRPWPQEQPEGVFDRRARAADRLYSEGTFLGRRTDRGETFILYGPPDSVRYWSGEERRRRTVTIEIWDYSKSAPPGLDMKLPQRQYFFVQKEERTVRYVPRPGQLQSNRSAG